MAEPTTKKITIDKSKYVDDVYRGAELVRIKTLMSAARDKISGSLEPLTKGLRRVDTERPIPEQRFDMTAAVAEQLYEPLEKIEVDWKAVIESTKTENMTIEEYEKRIEVFFQKLGKEIPGFTASYLDRFQNLDPLHVMGKLYESNERADVIADILINQGKSPELFKSIRYALGMNFDVEGPLKRGNNAKTATFEAIKKHLDNRSEVTDMAWTALRLMDNFGDNSEKEDSERMQFAKFYTAKMSPTEAIKFLKEANTQGLYTVEQMKSIIENLKNVEGINQEEISRILAREFDLLKVEEYESFYDAQNNYMKRVRKMMIPNYGSDFGPNNPAAKMLTLGNLGKFIIQVGAVGTLFANVLANAFHAGKAGEISKLKDIINPYSIAAGVTLGVMHGIRKGKEYFKAEDVRVRNRQENALEKLRLGLANRRDTVKDFVFANDMNAMKAIWEYRTTLRRENTTLTEDLDTNDISFDAFLGWLKVEHEDRAIYNPTLRLLERMSPPEIEKLESAFPGFFNAVDTFGIDQPKGGPRFISSVNDLLNLNKGPLIKRVPPEVKKEKKK